MTHTQFETKLCNFRSYDLLFEDFLEVLQHERIQYVYNSNIQFCPKISFGANGPFGHNSGQNYTSLHLIISSNDLFEM